MVENEQVKGAPDDLRRDALRGGQEVGHASLNGFAVGSVHALRCGSVHAPRCVPPSIRMMSAWGRWASAFSLCSKGTSASARLYDDGPPPDQQARAKRSIPSESISA